MAGRAGLSWGFRPDCICAEAFGPSYYDHKSDDIPTRRGERAGRAPAPRDLWGGAA
jgi:hypothetical protein